MAIAYEEAQKAIPHTCREELLYAVDWRVVATLRRKVSGCLTAMYEYVCSENSRKVYNDMRNKTRAVIEMAILLVIAGTVQAATFINTCPFVITSPGDYLLSADLICGGGGFGITINSSNVTLKLEGHRMTAGAGGGTAILVAPNQPPGVVQNVHILGPGLITRGATYGFGIAVQFIFVTNSEVSGITVRGGTGVEVDSSDFVTITANSFGQNNGPGIYLADASATISENNVSGGGGIFINDQRGIAATTTVSHNGLNGNGAAGLFIGSGVGVTVENNVINGNIQYGIYVANSNTIDVLVTNNTSLANGESQLSVAPFDLFNETGDCPGVTWTGNTFFTANKTCIH